ncbi:hypothetical protein [Streptomyces buecherae]|uniref:Uncharacterized protein n=1 Tax=Streptomyces buecherae TaxID=2763006 RepID=A0A7H8NA58_9ACTN|nr:hypothetical protein [Streptomyces buecherae]QKW51311.1 hypothetical protein HUT08_19215 [Streptomyces buecherae]
MHSDLTDELRSRAGVFTDEHEGLWVTVDAGNTVEFGGARPGELFQAAADWLAADRRYEVLGVRWQHAATDPRLRLAISLDRAPDA